MTSTSLKKSFVVIAQSKSNGAFHHQDGDFILFGSATNDTVSIAVKSNKDLMTLSVTRMTNGDFRIDGVFYGTRKVAAKQGHGKKPVSE